MKLLKKINEFWKIIENIKRLFRNKWFFLVGFCFEINYIGNISYFGNVIRICEMLNLYIIKDNIIYIFWIIFFLSLVNGVFLRVFEVM